MDLLAINKKFQELEIPSTWRIAQWLVFFLLSLFIIYLIRISLLYLISRGWKRKSVSFRKELSKIIAFPLKIIYFLFFPLEIELSISLFKKKYHKHRRFFIFFWSHTIRLNRIRFLNVKSTISHSPASTFSIILSYVSILFGLILTFYTKDPISDENIKNFSLFFLIVVLVLFVPVPIYLRSYILNLPLEDYSSLIKSSLNESEMISFISYKIWRQCEKFDKRILWLLSKNIEICGERMNLLINNQENLKMCPNGILDITDGTNKTILRGKAEFIKKEYEKKQNGNIGKLLKEINDAEVELQRISTLIQNCSERLRIPVVEICEHIFQFSPTMYWAWMRKFSTNLLVISGLPIDDTHFDSQKAIYDRIRSLLYECDRFINRNLSFMEYQCQNIAFSDLHSAIIDYSSQSSSCEAVKIYIRLLSEIAEEYKKRLVKRSTFRIFTQGNQVYINRLAYVYWKRKTHVGLDLHHSAIRILEEIIKLDFIANTSERKKFTNLKKFLILKKFESRLKKYCKEGIPLDDLVNNIDALINFHNYVISYIENCRIKIRDKIGTKEVLIKKLKKPEYLFIVTFGYSKIVRDVIKYSIPKLLKENWKKLQKNCSDRLINLEGKIQNSRFKVIVFQSENESNISSRMIKYHLTEEKGSGFADVLVSNPDFIVPLINKETKILILMGAEAFDDAGRIIRTSCYKSSVKHFVLEAKKRTRSGDNVRVIVCAESFKHNEDIRLIESYFDDQYDRIEMYEPEFISLIISDDVAKTTG